MKEITLRPAAGEDGDFLRQVYASTREDEMAATGWPAEAVRDFLRMQFDLQDKHYRSYYPGADFQVIVCGGEAVGRLYVHRTLREIRIMDIALLKAWRRQGIAAALLRDLIRESEEKQAPLTLHVEFNNPVREYYARLGFAQGELRGVYYFMERRPLSMAEAQSFRQGG